jgi:hypothetical protein
MGIRTPDLLHAMEARYQLRHSPLRSRKSLAAPSGCSGPPFLLPGYLRWPG